MNAHYDNHANDIEFFDLHKPKIEIKKKSNFVDINDLSDNQIVERLEEVDIRLSELTELYNNTKHEGTFTILSKLHGFKSVIRANMRKRKLETNESLRLKITELEQQLGEVSLEVGKDQQKEINHIKLVNENLKTEIKVINERDKKLINKNKQLGLQLESMAIAAINNKEAEKTKRHEINIKSEKIANKYLKDYLRGLISDSEFQDVLLKLDSM